jgi:hypothetical protein
MRVKDLPLISLIALGLGPVACGDDGGSGDSGPGSTSAADDDGDDGGPTSAGSVDSTGNPTDPTDPTNPTDPTDPTGVDSTGEPPMGGDAAFRFNSLNVLDPHLFAPGLGIDATAMVNADFNAGLNGDDPMMPDGFLDLGLVLYFTPLDQADGASETMAFINADCTVDAPTSCTIDPMSMPYPANYTSSQAGPCLAADPMHLTAGYEMPMPPQGPCFTSDPADIAVVTSSVTIPLAQAQVSAQYVGDPAGNLVSGVVRGFISLEVAQSTYVEATISGNLDEFLKVEDMDDGGTGWWMYLSFTGLPVDYME